MQNKIQGHTKEDIAAFKLATLVRNNEIVLESEINSICEGIDKKKVIKKLKNYNVIYLEGVLQSKNKTPDMAFFFDKKYESEVSSDILRIGTTFYEGIIATGFPEYMKKDWIKSLFKHDADFSLFISPDCILNLEYYLKQHLKHVEDELYNLAKENMNNLDLENIKKELIKKINNIAKGNTKLYKLSFYILSKGVSKKQTNESSKKIISNLNLDGIEGKYATNYQQQLFNSTLPKGVNELNGRQIIVTSKTLGLSFPFRSVE